jgi:hypothetical protein
MPLNPRTLRPGSAFTPKSISGLALWLDGSDASTLYTTDAGPVTAVAAPTEISGCVGWWDASDAASITQSGGLVSQWNDKSGNNRHATASGGARPTLTAGGLNGRSVVTFDGTDDQMLISSGFLQVPNVTILSVFKYNSGQYGGIISSALQPADDSSPRLVIHNGSFRTWGYSNFSDTPQGTSPTLVTGRVQAGASSIFQSGLLAAAGAASGSLTTGSTQTAIGSYRTNAGNHLNGYIAEIVVFDSALSTSDRARVEAYLAAKWGITGVHVQATPAGSLLAGYWGDKSGRGRHATQSTAASRPTFTTGDLNGRSTLRTVGSQAMSVPAWDYTAANTAVFVFRGSALNQGIYQRGALNNGPRSAIQGSPVVTLRGTIHGSAASQADTLASYAVGTWAIGATVLNSGSITAYASGVRGTSQNYSVQLSGSYLMHLFSLGSGVYPLNGGIAEFAYYDRELSAAELGRVTRYLGAKWGISLPPQVSNADAQSWINRVYGNGGTVSNSTAAAVNAFCDAIDAAGIRDRFYRLNLFCGTGLPACLVPLYQNWRVYAGRNRQLYGDNMTTSGWSKSGVTATLSTTERPFAAGPYANIVTANAATGVTPHIVSTANNFGYGTITVSAYIKAAGRNSARILLSGSSGMTFPGGSGVAFGTINLTTGATSSLSTGLTAVATNAGNGWWRLAITVTNSFGGNMAIRIDVGDGSSYNPTGSEAILVWGVQCETASSASEYDPYPLGGETDTNNNFVSSDYTETGASGGLTPFVTNAKWLNTGLTLDALQILATGHLSAYRAAHTGTDGQMIGLRNSAGDQLYRLYHRGGATQRGDGFWGGGTAAVTTDNNGLAGSQIVTRTSSTSAKIITNGTVTATLATSTTPASVARNFHVFADNDGNATPASRWFAGVALKAYSIGDGLTDAQALSLHNALTTFQTALSRA